jgi:TolA-binding protein
MEIASRYAVRHLDLLVGNNKKQKALSVFAEIRSGEEEIKAAETVFAIGDWYQEQNEFKQAISTYVYFTKQFKSHQRLPEVYFKLAQLLHERANNSSKARQILQAIIKSYPKHDLIPQAKEYLAMVA